MMCLACDERRERARRVARSLVERSCRRCLVQLYPLMVWAAMSEPEQAMADWHCTPCDQETERERGDAAAGERLETLLNPGGEPDPRGGHGKHKITDVMVEDAPTFSEILPRLTEALAGRWIVIYHRDYDTGRLGWELHLHHLARGTVDFTKHSRYGTRRHAAAQAWLDAQVWEECAMEQYAAFFGDWHDYWGSYTWQKLGGGHRALGDARAVISRLDEMAGRFEVPRTVRKQAGTRGGCGSVRPVGP
ncbi:3'-5' exonuclease [Streptomyces sp. NPDC059894]|uniref:3'-5' exonuclease n=1 Tax=unclassified Streptomyces TaxID=2593676 RepID=UPI003658F2AD